jgi:hypothetical protein
MDFRPFLKSSAQNLAIEQVLAAQPSVLLGVDAAAQTALAGLGITTVFDLSVSTIFDAAARMLSSSENPRSVLRRFGRAPAGLVDGSALATDSTQLPYAGIAVIAGVGTTTATALEQALSVSVVRDLALWPPFLAAKAIMLEAYNPDLELDIDPEAPADLVPKSGEFGVERHLYPALVMFPMAQSTADLRLKSVLFDITAPTGAGFQRLRYGALLTYAHTWTPLGVTRGHLLHSLPLAPGESTNVAVIDWASKSSASTAQTLSEAEQLSNTNDRARTVSQIANSVASEFTSGSSVTTAASVSTEGGIGGIASILVGSHSMAANAQTATTHTVSTGLRNIATNLQQNIRDSSQQVASSLRSERAATVSEVNQSQTEKLATRSVTNYNHMHALTLQYYEMVQVYEAEAKLENIERCIFLPMTPINFQDEHNIVRYLPILKAAALDGLTRRLLSEIEDEGTGGFQLAFRGTGETGQTRTPKDLAFFVFPPIDWFSGQLHASTMAVARDGLIGYNGNLNQLVLDFQLKLRAVRWSGARVTDPKTPITSVTITLDDNSQVAVNQSAPDGGSPETVDLSLNSGEPLPISRIRSISALIDTSYKPVPFPFSDGHLIRLELAIEKNGQSRWLDCSFVIQDGVGGLVGKELYVLSAPPALAQLGQILNENRLYYSQQVWLREDPQSRIMQLAPYQLDVGGTKINLVDHLSPEPLQVVGNYLVYRFTYEQDKEWLSWRKEQLAKSTADVDTVAVPTGGVFAEAVLGRANAAEKLDLTRFFDWADSPPPAPPSIAPLSAGTHTPTDAPPLGEFAAPLVGIQAPMALPDPTGLASVLTAITTNDAFRDMSGLSASGEAATSALDASGTAATGALVSAGTALATTLNFLADALSAKKGSEKTASETGAAINQKSDAAKADAKAAADKAAGKTVTPTNGDEAKAKLLEKVLSDLGLGSPSSTAGSDGTSGSGDAGTDPGIDGALLASVLVTEPTFSNVLDFVQLLQLVPDAQLVPLIAKRFSTLDKSVNALVKFGELVSVINNNSASLENPSRFLYAARFVKNGVLPTDADYPAAEIREVRASALKIAVDHATAVAKTINSAASGPAALSAIMSAAGSLGVAGIDEVSYLLATAHHESAMGRFTTEIANGTSSDTVFTRDAYFFNAIPGKKSSYNTLAGNVKAGTALKAAGTITSQSDVTVWNGTAYPDAQPAAVKRAARVCDFLVFIGRGFVQITGRANYQKFSGLPAARNVDLVANPDRAAEPAIAAGVMVLGMRDGMFRQNKKLADYDVSAGWDASNARDIVNGDKAAYGAAIREVAKRYKQALIQFARLDESKKII